MPRNDKESTAPTDPQEATPLVEGPDAQQTREERVPLDIGQGLRIGRYLLLKLLGQGGMGAVYAAYDPELDRKVALKLLRPDIYPSEQQRARLLREAQAMARVSHPNVLPVFDVGTWEGQVFIALEYIDGGTLGEWLKAQPRPWRQVLGLMHQAGQGLAAAHAAGLVHRDFKPANVLVGPGQRVYVTDFGLARAYDSPQDAEPGSSGGSNSLEDWGETSSPLLRADITQAGVIMGTPQYMPPEQYRGEVPQASADQFSFCVTLYWALYGQRPFTTRDMARFAAQGKARQGAPGPPPSFIREPPRSSRVPVRVRRAVMKGLSLEPSGRFASMGELLAALEPPAPRLRRRWLVAACALGAGLAVGGASLYRQSRLCSGSEQLISEVWAPSVRRRLEAALEATGSPLGRDTAARLSPVLDEYARAWRQQHTEACEATRVRGVQTEALLSLRVVCLERRRASLNALVQVLSQLEAREVGRALEAAYALPALDECANVADLASQQDWPADGTRRAWLLQLSDGLAGTRAMLDAGRLKEARERARALEPQVRQAAWLPLLAETRLYLGMASFQLGEREQGLRLLEQSLHDAMAGRADRLAALALTRLTYAEGERREYAQAERWAGLAQALLTRLGREPDLISELLTSLGRMESTRRRYTQAQQLLERAGPLQDEAGLPPEHPRRARLTYMRGLVASGQGQHAQAVALLTEALRQTQAAVGPQHPDTIRRYIGLSDALRAHGQREQALEAVRQALALSRVVYGPEDVYVANVMDYEVELLLKLGRPREAQQSAQQALALKQRALAPRHPQLRSTWSNLGQAWLSLGQLSEALSALEQALALDDVVKAPSGEADFALARALWAQGRDRPRALRQAARARERFQQAAEAEAVARVDAWLQSVRPQQPSRPTRRRSR